MQRSCARAAAFPTAGLRFDAAYQQDPYCKQSLLVGAEKMPPRIFHLGCIHVTWKQPRLYAAGLVWRLQCCRWASMHDHSAVHAVVNNVV